MVTYEDIQKANEGLEGIDLKGKNYVMVPQRVKAFRKLFPGGFINTELVSHDGTTVMMKTQVGYYEGGVPVILGTGFAQEVKGRGMVNGTSYIENCETSAVGRALGFLALGIDGGGICSAEELANAIKGQEQIKAEEKEIAHPPISEGKQVKTVSKVPPVDNPVREYIESEIQQMSEMLGIEYLEGVKKFGEFRKSLIAGGVIPNTAKITTMEEAKATFDAIYKTFAPSEGE